MSYLTLSEEELAALKKDLLGFIHRAASQTSNDAEVGALPDVVGWLYRLIRE